MLRLVEHEKFKFLPEFNARSEKKPPKKPDRSDRATDTQNDLFYLGAERLQNAAHIATNRFRRGAQKEQIVFVFVRSCEQTSQTTSACSDSIFIGGAGA